MASEYALKLKSSADDSGWSSRIEIPLVLLFVVTLLVAWLFIVIPLLNQYKLNRFNIYTFCKNENVSICVGEFNKTADKNKWTQICGIVSAFIRIQDKDKDK